MFRSFRSLTPVLAAGALGLAMTAAPAIAEEEPESTELSEGEKELAELLEGRVAGEPVQCLPTYADRRMRVIEDTAYVYGSGRTLYVQRTANPEDIDDDDILVTRRFGSTRLCRLDQITTVDRFSGFFSGALFFEEFVPYTRVKDDKAESEG